MRRREAVGTLILNQRIDYPKITDWARYVSKFGRIADFPKRRAKRLGETNEQVKCDVLFSALNGANVIAMAVNELSQILLGEADGMAALSYGRPEPTTLRGCRTNSHCLLYTSPSPRDS